MRRFIAPVLLVLFCASLLAVSASDSLAGEAGKVKARKAAGKGKGKKQAGAEKAKPTATATAATPKATASPAAAATKPAATSPAASAPTPEPLKVGTTLENLNAAYNGESNAHAKYLAYAKKADEEGYAKVASLFRAAAKAEEVHSQHHAEVIKKLGGEAKAEVKEVQAKTTRENLLDAIKGESFERDTMYPAYVKKAREEKIADAVETLNDAAQVEAIHVKLYTDAEKSLEKLKGVEADIYYVCPTCGNTVKKVDFTFKKCPACSAEASRFSEVK